MKPEAQRIAIAEACGWRRESDFPWNGLWYHPNAPQCGDGRYCDEEELPDYLSDLNACADMTKPLDAFQWEIYREELAEICTPLSQCRDKEQQYKFAMEATAAQRAEAFLRTIGKWEDDK